MLDDGLLDVSYVVDFPASEIPSLVSMLRPEVGLEALQSFGSMRVPWLEVSCSDGLQVCSTSQAGAAALWGLIILASEQALALRTAWLLLRHGGQLSHVRRC